MTVYQSLDLNFYLLNGPNFFLISPKLSSYLAGLIEGDGSIKVPSKPRSDKGKLIYPSVTIIFVEKDLPLAEFLTKKLNGTLNKASGG
jgi:hypothetical protein